MEVKSNHEKEVVNCYPTDFSWFVS